MKKSAQILSVIFHPYLLPLYGGSMIVSYSFLEILPISIRLLIVSGIFLFSGILPMLFHLTLSLFYLNKSEKKPYVRLTEILLYTVFLIFATIYLHKLNLPYWTQGYLAGAALSSALTWIINISGWRISFFMSGLGALMGLVVMMSLVYSPIPIGLLIALIVITGMMGTARQLLDRNTFAQILTGWICGLICVLLVTQVFRYNLFSFT